MLTINQFRERVQEVFDDIGIPGMLDDNLTCQTWKDLANELSFQAKRLHKAGGRIAAYAGLAARRVKAAE